MIVAMTEDETKDALRRLSLVAMHNMRIRGVHVDDAGISKELPLPSEAASALRLTDPHLVVSPGLHLLLSPAWDKDDLKGSDKGQPGHDPLQEVCFCLLPRELECSSPIVLMRCVGFAETTTYACAVWSSNDAIASMIAQALDECSTKGIRLPITKRR